MNNDEFYAQSVANEYARKDTSKVVALKKLDHKAKLPSEIFTYSFGVVAALLLGVGMCLTMKVIGDGSTLFMVIGIIIGFVGIILAGINYPLYKKIRKIGMDKYSFEINELAKQIIDEGK